MSFQSCAHTLMTHPWVPGFPVSMKETWEEKKDKKEGERSKYRMNVLEWSEVQALDNCCHPSHSIIQAPLITNYRLIMDIEMHT